MLKIIFDIDKKILKKLVIIKKFYIKLIFGKYINLQQNNYYKLNAIYIANNKYNMIKTEEKNLKSKVK